MRDSDMQQWFYNIAGTERPFVFAHFEVANHPDYVYKYMIDNSPAGVKNLLDNWYYDQGSNLTFAIPENFLPTLWIRGLTLSGRVLA